MDLKYTVLLITDAPTFMERVELAIVAHGLSFIKETIEIEDRVLNTQEFLERNFVMDASPDADSLFLKKLPLSSNMSDTTYYVCYSGTGAVTAFYRVSIEIYGKSEVRTKVTAITIRGRHRPYSEMNPTGAGGLHQ